MFLVQRPHGHRPREKRVEHHDLVRTARIWDQKIRARKIRIFHKMTTFTALLSLMVFPAGITLIFSGMLYEWADRKLVARFQNRIGPRWFQPLADTLKLLIKEEIKPQGLNSLLFYGLPIVALTGALTASLYAPILGFAPVYSFPGDLIVTLYLL